MDYSKNAEFGGYPVDMPSPHVFYPEVNGKGYQHLPSYMSNSHLQSNYYDSAYKHEMDDQFHQEGMHKGYRPRQHVSSGPFVYRRMAQEDRQRRETLSRNGLYSPNDNCHTHNDYPQYAGDSNGQWNVPNGYWQ